GLPARHERHRRGCTPHARRVLQPAEAARERAGHGSLRRAHQRTHSLPRPVRCTMNAAATTVPGPAAIPTVRLTEGALLDTARTNTGLADFGDEADWREGFQRLVQSLNEEARLN